MIEHLNQLEPTDEGSLPQLAISEIFGPTFQGEGPSLGRRCYFLRLAGCNQHCSFCDTPFTWDWTGRNGVVYDPKREVKRYPAELVLEELLLRTRDETLTPEPHPMLVISGGEPMLQQRRLLPLLLELKAKGWRLEIETAGTIFPLRDVTYIVDQFNVSPKLENSSNPLALRYRPNVINGLSATGKAIWKFVAVTVDDLDEIQHIVDEHHLWSVYIMPEGIDVENLQLHLRSLAEEVLRRGWNLTTRLQIELYGNRRGV